MKKLAFICFLGIILSGCENNYVYNPLMVYEKTLSSAHKEKYRYEIQHGDGNFNFFFFTDSNYAVGDTLILIKKP